MQGRTVVDSAQLKNEQLLSVSHVEESDAEALVAYLKGIVGESTFLTWEPSESHCHLLLGRAAHVDVHRPARERNARIRAVDLRGAECCRGVLANADTGGVGRQANQQPNVTLRDRNLEHDVDLVRSIVECHRLRVRSAVTWAPIGIDTTNLEIYVNGPRGGCNHAQPLHPNALRHANLHAYDLSRREVIGGTRKCVRPACGDERHAPRV